MLDAWEKILSEGEHCNKMALAETILSNPNAMPVSKELYQQLSFLVNKHVAIGTDPQAQTLSQLCANAYISCPANPKACLSAGNYDTLREEFKNAHVGAPSCGTTDAEAPCRYGSVTYDECLSEMDLLAPFVLTGACKPRHLTSSTTVVLQSSLIRAVSVALLQARRSG